MELYCKPFIPSVSKRDIGKQYRQRLDAAQGGVSTGSTPFALNTGNCINHGNNKNRPAPFMLKQDHRVAAESTRVMGRKTEARQFK